MKKLVLALLLVPALSTAAVKVDSRARCGEDFVEQSFELTMEENSYDLENSCGLHRLITLTNEAEDFAEFQIDTQKTETEDKGEVDCSSTLKVPYGEPVVFKCSGTDVDAELELIVTLISTKEVTETTDADEATESIEVTEEATEATDADEAIEVDGETADAAEATEESAE